MDIAAMSVVLSQANVKQQASLSVMKSVKSTAEQNGQALVDMLHASTASTASQAQHPNLGSKIDVKA